MSRFSIESPCRSLRTDNEACNTGFSMQTILNMLCFVMHFCPSHSSSETSLGSCPHEKINRCLTDIFKI